MTRRPIVWSIAGSDSGAGAGLQADLRAFDAMEVHGCTVVAAITAQNSVGVTRVEPVATDLLDAQIAALADDLPPRAIKLGLLGSVANARCVAVWIDRLRQRGPVAVVLDPVWCATTGAELADIQLRDLMRDELLPRATVVTPNRVEAGWLLSRAMPTERPGQSARSAQSTWSQRPDSSARPERPMRPIDRDIVEAAAELRRLGAGAVVVTGGDGGGVLAADWLDTPEARGWLVLPRIATAHHHGSGCAFAASMAAALALDFCVADAAILAKMSTAAALREADAFGAAGAGAGAVRPVRGFALRREVLPMLVDHLDHLPQPFVPLSEPHMGLYAIANDADAIDRLLAAGVRTLQLRIKDADRPDLVDQVARSVHAATEAGAQLFINDHWRLAIEHGAYGVHLGQEDLLTADLPTIRRAGLRLGISTHSVWEVCRAVAHAPSYLACGPIYATTTKAMPWLPQGAANLAYWCAVVGRPVVAIGGMDDARAAEAVRCGAAGVAVLRGLAEAPDLAAAVRGLQIALLHAGSAVPLTPPTLPRSTCSGD